MKYICILSQIPDHNESLHQKIIFIYKAKSVTIISIHLGAAPFNITIIQIYAPTSSHDDSEVDHFFQQLQKTIDKTPKKDILVVQGDWNAEVGKDAKADW